MNIKQKMELKWNEMITIKNERESLFADFESNKERIAALHFEVEIKKLQYMLLKREQLKEIKKNKHSAVVVESAENVETINETCIELLQKRLIEHGYEDRLKQEGLVSSENEVCEECETRLSDYVFLGKRVCDSCYEILREEAENWMREN